MFLSNIEVILCRASESGNVGAVCRAMKNMGLSRLRLAGPQPLDADVIRARAVHAWDVWENARIFDTLAEAAADCSLVVGTTRRRGHNRKSVSMDPHTLAIWLRERPAAENAADKKIALVFGNERTGLDDAELAQCNIASHIPVTDEHPSLNLSHAVQIYAYELFMAFGANKSVKGEWTAMNQKEISSLADSIANTLESVGFYKLPGKEDQVRFLRDIISRAGLMDREGKYLKDIFSKAARLGSARHGVPLSDTFGI